MYKHFLRYLILIFLGLSYYIAQAQPIQVILQTIDSAIYNYDYVDAHNRILQYSKNTNDSGLLLSLHMRELETLKHMELYDESILLCNKILKNPLLNHEQRVDVLLYQALVYENLMQLDKAELALRKAKNIIHTEIAATNPQSKMIGRYYIRNSSYYRMLNRVNPTEENFNRYKAFAKKALLFCKKFKHNQLLAEAYMLLSFNPKLNASQSKVYMLQALNLWKLLGDDNAVAQMYANLAFSNLNQPELALHYNDSALAFLTKESPWATYAMVYESRYAVYNKMGIADSALVNYIQYKAYADSLSKDKMLISVERINQKAFLESQKLENHILKNTIEQEKRNNNGLIILAIFSIVLTLIFFYLSVNLSRKKKELAKSKSILSKNLEEKSLMLTELNHRVKNNLSMILGLMKLQRNNNKIHEKDWSQLESRIFTMATAHKLYSYTNQDISGSSINLNAYIKAIQESYQDIYISSVQFNLQVDAVHVSVENALPIGIIYNELVSNSIKHAKPLEKNCLSISFKIALVDNIFELIYADNGINFKDKVEKSTGFFILETLTKQFNGTLIRSKSQFHITLFKR